jgi:hypothetical protein
LRTRGKALFLGLVVVLLAILAGAAAATASAASAPVTVQDCLRYHGSRPDPADFEPACTQIVRAQCTDTAGKRVKSDCDAYTLILAFKNEKGCRGGPLISGPCNAIGGAEKVVTDPGAVAASVTSTAFDAVAGKFGSAATSILHQLTRVFLHVSTINLRTAGISGMYSLTWALSATVAVLLLIWQFTKLALTGQGSAAVTAITGLAKWALICVATLAVTQTALTATDEISSALIDTYYKDGGEKEFQQRIDSGFGHFFTTPQENTAMVFLLGVLAILVVLVLWGEMLLRQAALQVLLAVMPIVAAGSMMDGTKEWWPKARSAVISLILIKPVIVLIFVIGFRETGESSDLQPFLVGLLTIFLGALAWPSLAKFMTFTSAGGGGGLASGLLGAAGGTAGSMFMYGGGVPSGAGAVGGGRAFTKAVESENDASVAAGAGRRAAARGGAGKASGAAAGLASGGLLAAAALGAQAAKAGKEVAEGGMESMAAHADLGPGKDMGGQVSVPRSRGADSRASKATRPDGDPGVSAVPPTSPAVPQPDTLATAPHREAVSGTPQPPEIAPAAQPPLLPPAPRLPALPPSPVRDDSGGA